MWPACGGQRLQTCTVEYIFSVLILVLVLDPKVLVLVLQIAVVETATICHTFVL